MPSYDRALHALRTWLDSWPGVGHVAVGMARQGYDLQLTRYDEKGWRATFYTSGMEHSPTSATGTGWERTPWLATQRAAWEALKKADERSRWEISSLSTHGLVRSSGRSEASSASWLALSGQRAEPVREQICRDRAEVARRCAAGATCGGISTSVRPNLRPTRSRRRTPPRSSMSLGASVRCRPFPDGPACCLLAVGREIAVRLSPSRGR
jgi:hypothetical protein